MGLEWECLGRVLVLLYSDRKVDQLELQKAGLMLNHVDQMFARYPEKVTDMCLLGKGLSEEKDKAFDAFGKGFFCVASSK